MNLIIAIVATDHERQTSRSIAPPEIHVSWIKNYAINIQKFAIFNIIISYIFEKYRLMAWRRFGLATINESGIVMHNKYASTSRELMKVFPYML